MKSHKNVNVKWEPVKIGHFRCSQIFEGKANLRVRNGVSWSVSEPPFRCLNFALAFWCPHALDFPWCPVCGTLPLGKASHLLCVSVHMPAAAWHWRGATWSCYACLSKASSPSWDVSIAIQSPGAIPPSCCCFGNHREKNKCSWVKWGSTFQIVSVSDTLLGALDSRMVLKINQNNALETQFMHIF